MEARSFVGARLLGSHIDRIQGVIFGSVCPHCCQRSMIFLAEDPRKEPDIQCSSLEFEFIRTLITDLFEHVYHVKSIIYGFFDGSKSFSFFQVRKLAGMRLISRTQNYKGDRHASQSNQNCSWSFHLFRSCFHPSHLCRSLAEPAKRAARQTQGKASDSLYP